MSRDRASRRFYRVDSGHDLLDFMDRGHCAQHENRWTFEVAWEAANKGMSTVASSSPSPSPSTSRFRFKTNIQGLQSIEILAQLRIRSWKHISNAPALGAAISIVVSDHVRCYPFKTVSSHVEKKPTVTTNTVRLPVCTHCFYC